MTRAWLFTSVLVLSCTATSKHACLCCVVVECLYLVLAFSGSHCCRHQSSVVCVLLAAGTCGCVVVCCNFVFDSCFLFSGLHCCCCRAVPRICVVLISSFDCRCPRSHKHQLVLRRNVLLTPFGFVFALFSGACWKPNGLWLFTCALVLRSCSCVVIVCDTRVVHGNHRYGLLLCIFVL